MAISSSPRPTHRPAGAVLVAAVILVGFAAGSCSAGESPQSGSTQPRGAQGSSSGLDDETPQPGGKVVFGTEADIDGFNPATNRWAISGTVLAFAVYDPLAAYDESGAPKPYLAERFEHDPSGTVWTIGLRPDITFSNGVPLTADAVKSVLEQLRASLLVGPALAPITAIDVLDPLAVRITMRSPWFAFPNVLTSQIGTMPEPSTLTKGPDGVAPAVRNPIGTGPFTQVEWRSGTSWSGRRNPTYWRDDTAGRPLPYLDEVEFRPIVDMQARKTALESGDIQMLHTDNQAAIKSFREEAAEGKVRMVEDGGEGEEEFIVFNVTEPPLDDVTIRRALVAAIDTNDYVAVNAEGLVEPATGPFRPGSTWYAPVRGYPSYDPELARRLVDAYKAAHGGEAPHITLGTGGNDGITIQRGQYFEQQWKAVGFDVTIDNQEQAAFIIRALGGNFQANLWRQFGAPDPDGDYLWWTSANATGSFTLNVARLQSPCVDDAIERGRTQQDLTARKQAYADLQQCFADEVPYLFLFHDIWAVVSLPQVHGISNGPLPDGSPSIPLAAGDFGGVVRLTNTWIEH